MTNKGTDKPSEDGAVEVRHSTSKAGRSLWKRLFGKNWKDFTTNQRLTFFGILLAAAVSLFVWLWPNEEQPTQSMIVDANAPTALADSDSVAIAVDGKDNVVVAPHATYIERPGLDPNCLVEYAERYARLEIQSEQEKRQLTRQLDEAIKRVAELEAQGDDLAAQAVEQYRESGDTATLLEVLIRERERHLYEEVRHQDKRVELNHEIAAVAYLRGNIEVAKQAIDEILAIEPNDLFAIVQRGHIHLLQGRLTDGESDYLRVLRLAKDDGQRTVVLGNLGVVYQTRGDLDQAEQSHREALQINEQLGRLDGMAGNYGNLGVVYEIRGELDQAEELHHKALLIYEKLGRLDGVANAYQNLGAICVTRGELEEAERMHQQAPQTYEKIGSLHGTACSYANLGLVCASRGELKQGEQMFRKALDIYEKLGSLEGMAGQYGNLGVVCNGRGDLDQAEQMFHKALDIYEKLGLLEGVAKQYGNLGLVHLARREFDRAEQMHRQALEIWERVGSLSGKATVYGSLGLVYLARKDLERSREYFQRSMELFTQAGAHATAEKMRLLLRNLEHKRGGK